ncbi:hypothetical protein B9T33_02245 [Acinetobacter sp. ANC 5054]|uniref:DUF4256 domain-containing protein n=1 Tax=Acinetobacter sp. ANC 5054 TaxID=1977877 RepID=UPI000A351D83|nr:DUF4256 domain-containing protein [Acinetobacter sp. ANC 5054]OTG84623.1 hypothetical protein B9T33_02245 [Acinetobacter sp. ANC 5054]
MLQYLDEVSILEILQQRFEANMQRHPELLWDNVKKQLIAQPSKLKILIEMERTGGEPDIMMLNKHTTDLVFYDCSLESPKLRRSLCYDRDALESRKDHPPKNNVIDMVQDIGAELLTEEEYRAIQKVFNFDLKTSSWIKTPVDIRQKGGALFCDRRYDHVFSYHNGAQSYYSSRGFRCKLVIAKVQL